jgi:hypothetical protein
VNAKDSEQNGSKHSPNFIYTLISSRMQLRFVTVDPKCLNFATYLKDSLTISKSSFCPGFWCRDITTHLAFSVFISRPTQSLTSRTASVLFSMTSTHYTCI